MERVYLSMNQGTTEVQTELGSGEETFDELRSRAAIMRERAPDFKESLNIKQIDLASDKFFPRGYEAGHAFGRNYQIASLPSKRPPVTTSRMPWTTDCLCIAIHHLA